MGRFEKLEELKEEIKSLEVIKDNDIALTMSTCANKRYSIKNLNFGKKYEPNDQSIIEDIKKLNEKIRVDIETRLILLKEEYERLDEL